MKIKVKVIPRASKQEIIKMADGSLKVKLCSQPVNFKANKELVEVLADYYKTKKQNVSIL